VPGKANVYTLGEYGVNRVKSPIHLIDGELLTAQNADVPFEKGNRGLRKRPGMAKHNEVAAAGPILSMINIPIPDPYVPLITEGAVMYAVRSSAVAPLYQISTDGTTWSTSGSMPSIQPSGPVGGALTFGQEVRQHGGILVLTDGLYFLDAVDGHLVRWNGTTLDTMTSNTLETIADMGPCSAMELHEGEVFALGPKDAPNTADMTICRFTGAAWEHVVDVASWTPQAACSVGGRLYIPNGTQSMGYWSEASGWVDEGNFTGDVTAIPATDIVALPWGGFLVALGLAGGAVTGVLWERRGGSWVDVSPPVPNDGNWGPMAILDNVLYVGRHASTGPSAPVCQVWSYDGTTLALDEDLTALLTGPIRIRSMVTWNGALYVQVRGGGTNNFVARRSSAGAWTVELSSLVDAAENTRAELGFF
jgi:hypothetical protein